ncbi:MAG: ATP/GTP-binding protein [Staphylothermus sp.]|nr:ATP/GTP-binding protein [Staphylothermus sp.]
MVIIVTFVGPAGSGKTSLINAYGSWLRKELFLRISLVNFDPGVEYLPYKPDFDIREFFTLKEIMEKYKLGPNGAFLKASEMIIDYLDEIFSREPFSNIENYDLILIDTPGQMEAFIFRPSSTLFFRKLEKLSKPIIVFVIDASAIQTISDAVTLWFLGVLTQAKTGLTVVPVINKIDIASNVELAKLIVEKPEELFKLAKNYSSEGLISEVVPELISIALKTKGAYRPVMVSAETKEGLEELHFLIHEAFCSCGDLT